jgi:hypothetical protein
VDACVLPQLGHTGALEARVLAAQEASHGAAAQLEALQRRLDSAEALLWGAPARAGGGFGGAGAFGGGGGSFGFGGGRGGPSPAKSPGARSPLGRAAAAAAAAAAADESEGSAGLGSTGLAQRLSQVERSLTETARARAEGEAEAQAQAEAQAAARATAQKALRGEVEAVVREVGRVGQLAGALEAAHHQTRALLAFYDERIEVTKRCPPGALSVRVPHALSPSFDSRL